MSDLAEFLTRTARRHPERTALRLGTTDVIYAELAERSARAAVLLRAEGVRPGDRVALMLPNVCRSSSSSTTASCAPAASSYPSIRC